MSEQPSTGSGEQPVQVEDITVGAYRIPTEEPESDGTYEWDSTTIVVVQVRAAGCVGVGYTYADTSTACLISDRLCEMAHGSDAMNPPAAWGRMVRSIRNLGRPGISSMAIAAVDTALWDLKARVLGLPLADLLGRRRDDVPVYGRGGFTSYPTEKLQEQLASWVNSGVTRVKMKVGRTPAQDLARVRAAREAIGPDAELFVDANGAYSRAAAAEFATRFAEHGVSWFEEPVLADDLEGLRLVREAAPDVMEIAAGEYGYDLVYFRRMLEARAVDVIQPDVTRCAGITELLNIGALASELGCDISTHTAPALHLHVACALPGVRHMEHFHDHIRIESMIFDGASQPRQGRLSPDLTRPGNGLTFRLEDAKPLAV